MADAFIVHEYAVFARLFNDSTAADLGFVYSDCRMCGFVHRGDSLDTPHNVAEIALFVKRAF